MKYEDNDVYEGNFHKGMKHGYGKLINPKGTILTGTFKNDMPNGIFKIVYSDGVVHQGVDL